MGVFRGFRQPLLAVVLAALACVVAACTTTDPGLSHEASEPAPALVSAADLAAELGLRPADAPRSGRVEFVGGDDDADVLAFLPGTTAVSVRGREYDTLVEVRARDGVTWLTGDDADAIRRIWAEAGPVPSAPESAEPEPKAKLPPPPPKPPPRAPPKLGRVVIDAGHGGKDPGATSSRGLREKDVVLQVALGVARRLRAAGAEVTLTRDDDTFVELEERAAVGNRLGAALFVSVHADAAANRSATGYGVWVRRKPPDASVRAAREILRKLAVTGARNRGVKEANFRVLRKSRGPAVLVELGFLSNRREASRLGTSGYRERMAAAIAAGVLTFLGP